MSYPAPQEHPAGEETLFRFFYYRNIFCSKLREKASRQTQTQDTSFQYIPLGKMSLVVVTFESLF
jgi:hypothetical protein